MRKLSSKINICILYFYPIVAAHGFGWVGFDLRIWKLAHFMFLPILLLYSFYGMGLKRITIRRSLVSFLGAVLLSMIAALIIEGQPILLSYRASATILDLSFLLFLFKSKLSQKQVETFIWVNLLLYVILWLYALSCAPEIVFGSVEDDIDDQRGIFRINISNQGCVALAMFLSINKWKEDGKKIYLAFAMFAFVLIVLMLSRQAIIWSFIIGLYSIFRKIRKVIIVGVITVVTFMFIPLKFSDDSVIGALINLSEAQIESQESGDNNIRIEEYKYFFFGDVNLISVIVGHGTPHSDSLYGRKYTNVINDIYHFYGSDVGWAWIFYQFGIVGFISIIVIVLKSLYKKTPKSLHYAKLYLIYLVLLMIASYAIITYIIYFCIALYLIHNSRFMVSQGDNRYQFVRKKSKNEK